MTGLRLRERGFEVVAASGRTLGEPTTEAEAKRIAETAILAGQAERVRIYGPQAQLLMEAARVGPRHVSWYADGAISQRGRTNGH